MTTKTLTADVALPLWIKHQALSYTVSSKFNEDHMLVASNLSKSTSIDAAVERYKSNPRIMLSSWILLDNSKAIEKAKGATTRRAGVHNGQQQMTVQIKVKRRTVTIEKLTYKEKDRYEHRTETVNGETQYLNCSSEEKDITLNVVGPWNPVTGAVVLYHYEEGALKPNAMLPKYLVWNVDDKNNPISPTATS